MDSLLHSLAYPTFIYKFTELRKRQENISNETDKKDLLIGISQSLSFSFFPSDHIIVLCVSSQALYKFGCVLESLFIHPQIVQMLSLAR